MSILQARVHEPQVREWRTMTSRLTYLGAGWLLPVVLSTMAGAVDVTGFLALGGLFTAHITGNLVIVAAHYVTGGFSQVGPLLAVPVFMAVLGLGTLASGAIARAGSSPLRPLLALEVALLAGFLGLGVGFGPFPDADSSMAVFAGMLAVAAMATQNATVKLAIKQSPSTAVMTTNITQLTVDLATIVRGVTEPEELTRARHRAGVTFPSMVGFLAGCASGAVLEIHLGLWALALPAVLATLALTLDMIARPHPTLRPRNDGTVSCVRTV
jgi:uncharacterized membrane protein YoaK (UPF0700 family)